MRASKINRQIKTFNISFPDVKFKCIRCGNCCRNTDRADRKIFLTNRDIEIISVATKLKVEDFADKSTDEKYPYAIKLISGKCFFLDDRNMCLIYPHRPLVCRFYPFLMRKIGTRYVFEADPSCPGLNYGENLDEKYFLSLVEEAKEHLEAPKSCGVPRS